MFKIFFILSSMLISVSYAAEEQFTANEVSSASVESSNHLAETFLKKGRFEVGGGFRFSSSASTGDSSLLLAPFGAYFIKDRLSLNAALGVSYTSTDSKIRGDYGIGASYYFNGSVNFAPYISQSLARTYGSSDESNGGATDFGVLYFLAPNVALRTAVSYAYNFEQSLNEGQFNIVSAFSIFF
jgi:hypothetical protein